jgi:hypothetical protein
MGGRQPGNGARGSGDEESLSAQVCRNERQACEIAFGSKVFLKGQIREAMDGGSLGRVEIHGRTHWKN